jgi:hypothetical protein
MKKRQTELSTDFAWTSKQRDTYHEQYVHLADGDRLLAGVAIKAIANHGLLNKFDSAHIMGVGAVPRGAGIILPTLTETATLTISDSTDRNVGSTKLIMAQIAQGDPRQAHWRLHEQDMAEHDPRWTGAIGKAAVMATYKVFDLLRSGVKQTEVAGMEYVAESMLSEKDDYEKAIRRFTGSATELIYMAYSVNSNGWMAGDRHHPAYPVSVDQAAEYIEREGFELLHDPHEGFAPKADGFRQDDDPHDFDGFAAMVAIRK